MPHPGRADCPDFAITILPGCLYRAKRQPSFTLPERPYDWDSSVIRDILTAKEYIGMTVNHKKYRPTYKSRSKTGTFPVSEWQYIADTHEPLVSEALFYAVQEKLIPRPANQPMERTNPFKGLVNCADCGAPMSMKRQRLRPLKDSEGNPTGKVKQGTDGFECHTYTMGKKHKETICSRHWVNTDALTTIVLDALKSIAGANLSERDLFQRFTRSTQDGESTGDTKKLLRQKQTRSAELDRLIEGAYEANFRGKLTDQRLTTLVAKYEAEQEGLEQEIAALTKQMEQAESGKPDVKQFLNALRRFTSFDTLTQEMVDALVEKIIVHERTGKRGSQEQEIELYFKFVGKVGDYK